MLFGCLHGIDFELELGASIQYVTLIGIKFIKILKMKCS